MALVLNPKHIGSSVKIAELGKIIEVKIGNEKLLLSLGQTQFFKEQTKTKKEDVSNNEVDNKLVVHKRKRKSDPK